MRGCVRPRSRSARCRPRARPCSSRTARTPCPRPDPRLRLSVPLPCAPPYVRRPGKVKAASELGVDPVHHRPQLTPLTLDLRVLLLAAHPLEVLLPGAVLGDPLARELA